MDHKTSSHRLLKCRQVVFIRQGGKCCYVIAKVGTVNNFGTQAMPCKGELK